ncbi:hypothetical protein C8F01DRAFT_1092451 [Mycena amicta]|nr:hypothetical protein C8F01DRAFT_1092451 [Mycena amicta]
MSALLYAVSLRYNKFRAQPPSPTAILCPPSFARLLCLSSIGVTVWSTRARCYMRSLCGITSFVRNYQVPPPSCARLLCLSSIGDTVWLTRARCYMRSLGGRTSFVRDHQVPPPSCTRLLFWLTRARCYMRTLGGRMSSKPPFIAYKTHDTPPLPVRELGTCVNVIEALRLVIDHTHGIRYGRHAPDPKFYEVYPALPPFTKPKSFSDMLAGPRYSRSFIILSREASNNLPRRMREHRHHGRGRVIFDFAYVQYGDAIRTETNTLWMFDGNDLHASIMPGARDMILSATDSVPSRSNLDVHKYLNTVAFDHESRGQALAATTYEHQTRQAHGVRARLGLIERVDDDVNKIRRLTYAQGLNYENTDAWAD